MTPPTPDAVSHTARLGVIGGIGPEASANGAETASPTSIIQATVADGPMIRLDLEEARFAAAQKVAAPKPPRMEIMA